MGKRKVRSTHGARAPRPTEPSTPTAADQRLCGEGWYRRIVEASQEGILLLECDGRVALVNPALSAITGYPAALLLGRPAPASLAPADRVLAGPVLAQGTATPPARTEREFTRRDGRPIWIRIVSASVLDDQGQFAGTVALIRDSTTERETTTALRASEVWAQAVFDQAAVGMVMETLDGHLLQVNDRVCALLALRREDLIGRHWRTVVHPEHHAERTAAAARLLADPQAACTIEARMQRGDGGTAWAQITLSLVHGDPEESPRILVVGDEISAYKQAIAALHDSEARMRAVVENAVDGIVTLDDHGILESANAAAVRLFGYSVEELVGHSVNLLIPSAFHRAHEAHLAHYRSTGQAVVLDRERETTGRRKDGSTFPLLLAVSEMLVGGQRRFTGILRDLTDRTRAEELLRHQALHDPLTGLPNPALLRERLAQAITAAGSMAAPMALLILNLAHFAEVNDTFGHQYGDQVLVEVAARLRVALREPDLVARLDGDEFAVILPGDDAGRAVSAAARLGAVLDTPILVQGVAAAMEANSGVAAYPEHGTDADTLFRHAAVALHAARRDGEPVLVYSRTHDVYTPERLTLAGGLRDAIRTDQLVLHYQPQAALATGQVTGLEALVRWQHPEFGLVSPDRFIPLAERSGQIGALTTWVLERAIHQQQDWLGRLPVVVPLAVNISAANLCDVTLAARIADILALAGVPPDLLRVEVTESIVMADPERAGAVLAHLAALGIGVAIDDFGTGYANLAYLSRLPVDELKIDRSFVGEVVQAKAQAAIVASTVGLGHALGLRVVAEGVEDAATWEALATLGCDVGQGYYLARPMPAATYEHWLARRIHGRAAHSA